MTSMLSTPLGTRPSALAAGSAGPTFDVAREARLRGNDRYRRTATAAELEADLGMLRGLQAVSGRLSLVLWLAALAVLLVFGGMCALIAAESRQPELPASITGGIGFVLLVAVLWQRRRVTALRRDKLELASELLRRLDVAPGSEVTMALHLGFFEGSPTRHDLTGGAFSAEKSHMNDHRDEWLTVEGVLATGMRFRIARTSLMNETVTISQRGNQRVTRTATSRSVEDCIELQYDPRANPALGQAGPAVADALQVPAGAKIHGLDNRPGALSVRVVTPLPVKHEHRFDEMAPFVARVLWLVDPARLLLRERSHAAPPELSTEGELQRRGLAWQLRHVADGLPAMGAIAVLAMALGVGVLALGQLRQAELETAMGQYARTQLAAAQAELARTSAPYERRTLEERIRNHQSGAAAADERATESTAWAIGEGASALLLAGAAAGLLLWSRMRAARARSATALG